MNFFYSIETLIFVFTLVFIFSLCIFIPIFSQNGEVSVYTSPNYYTGLDISDSNFVWPTPGFNYITSGFGYRKSPTTGAGTYHSGIDIGAPQGSNIVACQSR